MRPIAIFRHTASEGPGHFTTFLEKHAIPWRVFESYKEERAPDINSLSGLVFMGGAMSVNDPLAWIPRSLQLIRDAVSADVPVMGHCLGGQLLAKALGGVVTKNAVKEIGWGEVRTTHSLAKDWLGELPSTFEVFHWHGETFTLPTGATRILASKYCENQAFVIGKHLGMQCHVEMTVDMIRAWTGEGAQELLDNPVASVQSASHILKDVEEKVKDLNRIAESIYGRWLQGVSRG